MSDLDAERQPKVLLADLTSVIDGSLIVAFFTALYYLRRRDITVSTLAHALSMAFLVATVGHYTEQHLVGVDGVEDLFRPLPKRKWLDVWSALVASMLALAAVLARFWNCQSVNFDCVVGEMARVHYPCKLLRLQYYGPVFVGSMVFVLLAISTRLNGILGGSVLHPRDGGYLMKVLVCPPIMAAVWITCCFSVWLYSILVEAEGHRLRIEQGKPGHFPSSDASSGAFEPWSHLYQHKRQHHHHPLHGHNHIPGQVPLLPPEQQQQYVQQQHPYQLTELDKGQSPTHLVGHLQGEGEQPPGFPGGGMELAGDGYAPTHLQQHPAAQAGQPCTDAPGLTPGGTPMSPRRGGQGPPLSWPGDEPRQDYYPGGEGVGGVHGGAQAQALPPRADFSPTHGGAMALALSPAHRRTWGPSGGEPGTEAAPAPPPRQVRPSLSQSPIICRGGAAIGGGGGSGWGVGGGEMAIPSYRPPGAGGGREEVPGFMTSSDEEDSGGGGGGGGVIAYLSPPHTSRLGGAEYKEGAAAAAAAVLPGRAFFSRSNSRDNLTTSSSSEGEECDDDDNDDDDGGPPGDSHSSDGEEGHGRGAEGLSFPALGLASAPGVSYPDTYNTMVGTSPLGGALLGP